MPETGGPLPSCLEGGGHGLRGVEPTRKKKCSNHSLTRRPIVTPVVLADEIQDGFFTSINRTWRNDGIAVNISERGEKHAVSLKHGFEKKLSACSAGHLSTVMYGPFS